jgi:hypothetical protein
VIIANEILKFERCVKEDLVLMFQNNSHWRAIVETEVYFHSFLRFELGGASISFTVRCPSNWKLDGFQARCGRYGEDISVALVDSLITVPQMSSPVSTPTTL